MRSRKPLRAQLGNPTSAPTSEPEQKSDWEAEIEGQTAPAASEPDEVFPKKDGPSLRPSDPNKRWTDEFARAAPPPLDPLAALEVKVRKDQEGIDAAYTPEAAAVMAAIQAANEGAYLRACVKLKAANDLFSKTAMDRLVRKERAESVELGDQESASDALMRLAASAELVASEDETAYADFRNAKGHRVTSPIKGKAFSRWLLNRYSGETGRAPASEVLKAVLNALDARAVSSGIVREVFPRVGHYGGKVYIDRGSADWSAIEIDADGWRLVAEPPCRFVRPVGCAELPLPVAGGSIADLHKFLNVDQTGLTLCTAWLLGALNPLGPYSVLAMFGQHGSAKTTALLVLRRLIDPNLADMRPLPPTERDLLVAARKSRLQAFDNISNLSPDMSDTLCRLATGGGLVMRALFTDGDEFMLTAKRPICLNGIVEVVTRPDLVDRSVFVTALPLKKRRREKEFWAAFDAARPALLGALYDAVSCALRNADAESPEDLPRMADFADWVAHGEPAFGWAAGTFLSAYRANLADSAQIAIEADLLASALLRFMHVANKKGEETDIRKDAWSGPAAKLLDELNVMVGERQARNKDWPQSPNALGHRLARVIPPLAQLGLQVSTHRANGKRSVALEWLPASVAEAAAVPEAEPAPEAAEVAPTDPKPPPGPRHRFRVVL